MNQLSGPVLQWIREGYPDGVPDDETAALLAVLQERIGRASCRERVSCCV